MGALGGCRDRRVGWRAVGLGRRRLPRQPCPVGEDHLRRRADTQDARRAQAARTGDQAQAVPSGLRRSEQEGARERSAALPACHQLREPDVDLRCVAAGREPVRPVDLRRDRQAEEPEVAALQRGEEAHGQGADRVGPERHARARRHARPVCAGVDRRWRQAVGQELLQVAAGVLQAARLQRLQVGSAIRHARAADHAAQHGGLQGGREPVELPEDDAPLPDPGATAAQGAQPVRGDGKGDVADRRGRRHHRLLGSGGLDEDPAAGAGLRLRRVWRRPCRAYGEGARAGRPD